MPKNEDNEEIILKNKIPPTQIDDLDLYQILIEESRHLHSVWIDNFRIIITFNSILLAGAFTLLTIALKNEASTTATDVLPWALRTLALIGIVITIVGLHIIRRTKAITSLRHKELCYIEQIYKPISGVMPFNSGSVVLGEKGKKFLSSLKTAQ